MKEMKMWLRVSNKVKQYLIDNAHTYEISKGKMLKDDMPADIKELLRTA